MEVCFSSLPAFDRVKGANVNTPWTAAAQWAVHGACSDVDVTMLGVAFMTEVCRDVTTTF